MPSAAESLINGLLDSTPAGETLIYSLIGSNEEGDFEGEFEIECRVAEQSTLDLAARQALAAAARRLGAEDLARVVLVSDDPPDVALIETIADALCDDPQLEADLVAALEAWAALHHLQDHLNGLMISASETHALPSTPSPADEDELPPAEGKARSPSLEQIASTGVV